MRMGIGMGLSRRGGGNAAVAYYTANGKRPDLVADFAGASGAESYVIDGAASTFATMFPSFARSGNATMVDSDGNLKWAPHNLLTYSEDATQWSNAGVTVSAGAVAEFRETTANSLHYAGFSFGAVSEGKVVFEVLPQGRTTATLWIFTGSLDVNLDFENETFSDKHAELGDPEFESLPDGYVRVSIGTPVARSNTSARLQLTETLGGATSYEGDTSKGINLRYPRIYRSDLGGMADNPNRGDSYVPTTSAAVYMPRRNHHVYEGGEWVNKGVLIETEARTNLDPNSDDLSAWTASNTTIAKDQTGADGEANSAHSITATANSGTALEQITAASADHVWGCLMKRITGSGTVEVTVDGGAAWVDVTSDINSSVFVRVSTGAGATVTDPEFGVRLGTSGDVVAVQVSQLEQTSGQISSPIPTAGSTVTRAADSLPIAAANLPYSATAMSIAMKGLMTYADLNSGAELEFLRWRADASNYIITQLRTDGTRTGATWFLQNNAGTVDSVENSIPGPYSPGVNVPFSVASRHGATVINGAVDGTALTEDTTPTALPDLSATNLVLAQDFMGTISSFVMWDEDIADAGIEAASA